MSDPSDEAVRRVPAPLRALWRLGMILTVVSTAGIVYAEVAWKLHPDGYTGTDEPPELQVADVLSGITANTLTSGIICLGLALAVAALRGTPVRGEVPRPDASDGNGSAEASATWAAPVDRASGTGTPPIDPEAFRRPRSSSGPRS